MFKKNEEVKTIEELTKAELTRVDIDFLKTDYGKRLNRLTMVPIGLTIFTGAYVFTEGLANGYINITNISILLMIGFGITAIARMMYYQSLARFYHNQCKKK